MFLLEKMQTRPFSNALTGIELAQSFRPTPNRECWNTNCTDRPYQQRRSGLGRERHKIVLVIGELLLTGKLNLSRTIALTGSKFSNPQYVTAIAGAQIAAIVQDNLESDHARIISGNVLSGCQVQREGFVGYYDNQITAIPEGDDYEFFGWNKPVFNKISTSRALTFSWLTPKKKYDLTTNTNGEHRAFVVTGSYEKVFPLDLYPMQLLKACMYKDLDEMEALGAYEVAPEDFALTEFICVSKQPHQKIIREGLDLMREELG